MAEVESVSSVTGMIKYNLSQMALKNTDYHQDALKSMLPPEKDDVALNLFLQHKGKDITPEELSYETEEKLNHMYRIRSDGYDIAKYQSFELLNSGVRDASDTLKYRETFTINQFVEKVGPHYVLNLSKLSADQMAFTDKQKAERRNDVYIDFPRAYRVTYSLTIPEGYEARGLDAYNQHVDNPYGSTRMEGRVEGDRALITVTKTYKQSFIPKSAWPEVMEFLKPGEKMNYARIVLSKIES